MWVPPFLRPSTPGLGSDQRERLIQALEEQNRLLRLQLGEPSPKRVRATEVPTRKRTAADVTIVTRDAIAEEQERARQKQALADSPS